MAKDTELELCLRLNAAETQALRTDAKRCGLSRNAYLRRLIMKAPVVQRPSEAIHNLYVEINRIGNNINQIARSVNAGIATPEDAAQALFLLKKIYTLMEKAADPTWQ